MVRFMDIIIIIIILYYIECDIMSIYYEQCGYIYGIKRISKIEKILRYTYTYI